MSLVKSKELLQEVIGEDGFLEFEVGLPVRTTSPDGWTYWFTKQKWGISLKRLNQGHLAEGMIKAKGYELYDKAASFATAAKLGKVDWRCGSIEIELPKEMPPQSPDGLSFLVYFTTFLLDIGSDIIKFIKTIPRHYVESSISAFDPKNRLLSFGLAYVLGGGFYVFIPHTFICIFLERMLPESYDMLIAGLWVVGGFGVTGPINALIMHYIGWKHYWEVKMRED